MICPASSSPAKQTQSLTCVSIYRSVSGEKIWIGIDTHKRTFSVALRDRMETHKPGLAQACESLLPADDNP
jgi:hypothetical protein